MAAAVADFTPAHPAASTGKLKRRDAERTGSLSLTLVPTPDLLASLSAITRPAQTIIGFALEPAAHLQEEAMRKLHAKNLDAIVANPLETMDSAHITATLLWRDGRATPAPQQAMPKDRFAVWLLEQIAPVMTDRLQRRGV